MTNVVYIESYIEREKKGGKEKKSKDLEIELTIEWWNLEINRKNTHFLLELKLKMC